MALRWIVCLLLLLSADAWAGGPVATVRVGAQQQQHADDPAQGHGPFRSWQQEGRGLRHTGVAIGTRGRTHGTEGAGAGRCRHP